MQQTREYAAPGAIMRVGSRGSSDRGSVRAVNEDTFLAQAPYWVVADGMGGHAHGDRASRAAVEVFAAADASDIPSGEQVLSTIVAANDAVTALAADGSGFSGTTLTGLALVRVAHTSALHWMVFNVGDSRTYTWNGRELDQVSVDHSAVQELIERGALSVEDAAFHPQRNVVTRALGADDEVEPDLWVFPVAGRQTFLLCSDGLTKELGDDEIARIVRFHEAERARQGPDAAGPELADRLVGAAVAAGGRDNVTVVVVESVFEGAGRDDDGETRERPDIPGLLEDTTPRG